mmetsp:Transcript_58002/g.135907  ORF Transcript_58002/g.135907 Transcript_58002/m.135907 type:complete len:209 (+) Transcript_58002:1626-2252(+)
MEVNVGMLWLFRDVPSMLDKEEPARSILDTTLAARASTLPERPCEERPSDRPSERPSKSSKSMPTIAVREARALRAFSDTLLNELRELLLVTLRRPEPGVFGVLGLLSSMEASFQFTLLSFPMLARLSAGREVLLAETFGSVALRKSGVRRVLVVRAPTTVARRSSLSSSSSPSARYQTDVLVLGSRCLVSSDLQWSWSVTSSSTGAR